MGVSRVHDGRQFVMGEGNRIGIGKPGCCDLHHQLAVERVEPGILKCQPRGLGKFRAITQSGDVSFGELSVPVVAVETVSGDAHVKGVTGRTLKVRAVSGDASAEDVAFELDTHLDTVSGYVSLALRGPLSTGTINLVTVSGDGELKLPRAADATLEITTKGGDVKGKIIGPDGKTEKDIVGSGMVNISETVGKGAGAKIVLSSVSGDLQIDQESSVIEIS